MADGRLTELARHGNMLCVIQVLVSEEDDLPFQKRIPYRLQLVRRQRFGQIDAADFRTDMQRQGNDLDGL
jgi:hypothetical protein